ncbi:E3 ubiquitin-protein ligase rnf168 isoform X2 [Pleuronectes platessa]|uniref:E3 ubiquitin-protein ligase rnf168 isoform X2 n=1 Tax=Pleuronectes platessa TaxID=8262 RepID=UPI00232A41E1|nr:E3 ubiquitin-protein ligase rnf168 isoform X2 [Pleuronectes platessa]
MSPVSKEEEGGGVGRPLSLDDCRCPVCLEIIIEPVTLPCTHTFCKVCFLETVDKSTLCCPMCRKRVSSWARLNSRKNTLVDQQLWNQIQSSFPLQCERRLKGQEDEDDPGVLVFAPSVSRPGEVRQEYEDQIMKLTEEKRVMEEEERRASDELIQRLLAEEEVELQEETRRREADEQLARLLNNQLNSSPVTQGNIPPAAVTPPTNRPKEVGSIDRFFSPLSSKTTSDCSSASNSLDNKNVVVSTKRTNSDLEITDEEATTSKRSCPSSSPSPVGGLESELQSPQRQQEEGDRRIAQLLQKELDHEEKLRNTDRRKGSADAYQLRDKGGKVGVTTPNRSSRKMKKISSSSSSCRGQKQTTLTDMFSMSS